LRALSPLCVSVSRQPSPSGASSNKTDVFTPSIIHDQPRTCGASTRVTVISVEPPVAKVWPLSPAPERLEDWLGAANIDLRVGGKLHLTFANGGSTEITVTRVDAPHVLGWSWMIDGVNTSVLFELAPDGGRLPAHADA